MAPVTPHALASLYRGGAGNIACHAGIWRRMKDCREGGMLLLQRSHANSAYLTHEINDILQRHAGIPRPHEGLPNLGDLEGSMLISNFVQHVSVRAKNSSSGKLIVCNLDPVHGTTMTMNTTEAAALRDALTQALLTIPEGQR